jgi:hypothetical protein
MGWLQEHQRLLADFLWDSIDSVEEEAVAPLDLSYRPVERSWWKQLAERRQLRYGVRPLSASPYAFLSMAFKDGENLLMMSHIRYRLREFGDHRFELALSVPLAPGLSVDVGTFYQFGQSDIERKLVVKVFKEFAPGSFMHIGLEAGRSPQLFAGMAFNW